MLFVIEVKDGNPQIDETMKKLIRNAFKQFDGKETYVEIKEKKRERTLKQNNYLWGVVYPLISSSTGHDSEELHDAFKKMFLGRKFIEVGETELEVTKTSTNLSTAEFNEFVERVIAFAGTLGIAIPPPEAGYVR
jgi:hypothetical protein